MNKLILLPIALMLATGCDMVKNDKDIQPTQAANINLFATKNKSTVIDLRQLFPMMTSAKVLAGGDIGYFGDRYVRFKASTVLNDFSFVVNQSNNSIVQTNVKIQSLSAASNDCSANQPFTYAKISNKESLVVNLLNNPEFCGYDTTQPLTGEIGVAGSRSGVDVDQNSDAVNIAICACSGDQTAILTYQPPAGFVGQVKFTYYLFVNGDASKGNDVFYDPQYSEYFSTHAVIIDVTE